MQGVKPARQRKPAFVEQGPRRWGKLFRAARALKDRSARLQPHGFLALRTNDALRPALLNQIASARRFVVYDR